MTPTYEVFLDIQHDANVESWGRAYAFTTVPTSADHVSLWEPTNPDERSVNARVEARIFGVDGKPHFMLAPLEATYNDVRVWVPDGEQARFVPIGGYADLENRLTKAGWKRIK